MTTKRPFEIGLGGLRFTDTARSIELLATEVLPVVRREATRPTSSRIPAGTDAR